MLRLSGYGIVRVSAMDLMDAGCTLEKQIQLSDTFDFGLRIDRNPLVPGQPAQARVTPILQGMILDWHIAPHTNPALAGTANALISPANTYGYANITDVSGDGVVTITVTNPNDPSFLLEGDVMVLSQCNSCNAGFCSMPGSAWFQISSIDAHFSLGRAANDQQAGEIVLRAESSEPANGTPQALTVLGLGQAEVIEASGALRQVVAPEAFVDVVVVDEYAYDLRFYDPAAQGSLLDGVYEVAAGATPYVTWTIENPDRSATVYDRLRITEDRGGSLKVNEYTWDGAAGSWSLSEANGEIVTTKTESLVGSDRVERETVRDALNIVASDSSTTHHDVTCGAETREQIIQQVDDPDSFALTTIYGFYEEAEAPATGSCGLLEEQVNPDGSWVRYEYDTDGRKTLEVHSWLDAPVGSAASLVRTVAYDYTAVDAADTEGPENVRLPRTVTETIEGVVVAKTYTVYSFDASGRTEIVERVTNPAAAYGDATNQRTETSYFAFGAETAGEGKVSSVLHPDGRLDTYTYAYGTYASAGPSTPGNFTAGSGTDVRETVVHGTSASPAGITNKTTTEVRITDTFGNTYQEETWAHTAGADEQIAWTIYILDEFGRPTETHRSDGTVTETDWTCCGKDSDTDSGGTTTSYSHDDLGRVETATRCAANGTTVTTYGYDAEGRVTSEDVVAGALSRSSTTQYDSAGRLWIVTDPAGLVTTYDYANGGRTTTLTRPGGTTETTERYLDGRVKSVTGTGVVARYYTYGVNADGTQWTRVSTGSPASAQWEATTTDALGRTIAVEKPAFGGGTETIQQFYNSAGQLERTVTPGQADTLYEYDEVGNLLRSGLDVDDSGALELASLDRIDETEAFFAYMDGAWWQQTEQRAYPTDFDGTPVTVNAQRTRLTGLGFGLVGETVAIDVHGNETVSQVTLDRTTATETRTTDFPDSTIDAVDTSVNGLLMASQSKTGVVLTYDYDELGRRTHITDSRTGTAVVSYNTLGQVEWVDDPAQNRTSYTYQPDTGRLATETNAKDYVTRYAYDDRGQVTHVWGDAAIPVQTVYDELGRKTEMHTYRDETVDWNAINFPGFPGTADVTTWHYDRATGLLASKEDATSQSVVYAYTDGGRLWTRTWARLDGGSTLVTTYGYDPDTAELTSIDYSDATPDVGFTYDRLGRQDTVTDAVGSRTFTYDPLTLQLDDETITGLTDATLTRTYEDATGVPGRSNGIEVDTGYTVTYGYEPDTGRFGGVTWAVGAATGALTYSYVPDSNLLYQKTVTSGPVTTLAYEPLRDLVTQVQHDSAGLVVAQYDYQYNALAQGDSVQLSGRSFAAALNAKLLGAAWFENAANTGDGIEILPETRAYSYDPIGNRLDATDWDPIAETSQSILYTPNALNQYDDFTVGAGPAVVLGYDADGNLETWNDGTTTTLYTYNAENRLIAVEPAIPSNGDTKVAFLYDYMGRRAQKVVSQYVSDAWTVTDETFFVYDGWNLVQERHAGGGMKRQYVSGLDLSGSLQGAGGIGGLLFATDGLVGYHYLYDANGNVGQLLDTGGGTIAAHYEYDPFGTVTYASSSVDNPFQFSTKYLDTETNLYYYGYRYYSPELGRWLNRDPIGDSAFFNFYTANKSDDEIHRLYDEALRPAYLFASNNPVNAIDAFGLEVLLEAHPIRLTGQNHAKITIIPDCQARWAMDNRFAGNTTPNGEFYATLGAEGVGWFQNNPILVSDINRTTDLDRSNNLFPTVITPPAGMSDDDFIIALFFADSRYGDNLPYNLFPTFGKYNSNSYASGLLRSIIGAMPPQPPNTPGFTNPVPQHHFR